MKTTTKWMDIMQKKLRKTSSNELVKLRRVKYGNC